MILGLALLAYQWNWWWDTIIQHEPKIWLAEALPGGYGAAVALTLACGVSAIAVTLEL